MPQEQTVIFLIQGCYRMIELSVPILSILVGLRSLLGPGSGPVVARFGGGLILALSIPRLVADLYSLPITFP